MPLGLGQWRVEHHAWEVTYLGVLWKIRRQTPRVGVGPQQGAGLEEKSYLG